MIGNIYNEISSAVLKYSFHGDRTLEYIGIKYNGTDKLSCKVYRSNKNNFDALSTDIPEPIKRFHYKTFCNNYNLQFVDISYQKIDDHSSEFSLAYNISSDEFSRFDQRASTISKSIKKTLGCSNNPLFEIGYLLNEHSDILEKKYYYNIINQKTSSSKDKINYVTFNKSNYITLLSELFGTEHKNSVNSIFLKSLNYSYCPFLIGENIKKDRNEIKLYFILSQIMNRKQANDNFLKFISDFVNDARIEKTVKFCNEKYLFLRGYAVSFDSEGLILRLYFHPLKY